MTTNKSKEVSVEEVRSRLNKIYLRLAYGKSDIAKTKQEVDEVLTTYATQIRAERDAEWREHLETCKIEIDFVDGKPRAKIDTLPQSEPDDITNTLTSTL